MPKRVQLSRAKGWRMPENTVKADRTTGFGNPFPCNWPFGCPRSPMYDQGQELDGSASMTCCVDTFAEWVRQGTAKEESRLTGKGGGLVAGLMASGGNVERTKLVEGLPLLRGRNLACWCSPTKPCHCDVLLELANSGENADA